MIGKDPIEEFEKLMVAAEQAGSPLANAVAVATADEDGAPSVRMMLLKGVDEGGFVIYTNMNSRKSRELERNPRTSLCFWWPWTESQVRVEGTVTVVSDGEADAYFATRPRGSQIGAWASDQSRRLESRDELVDRYREFENKYDGGEVPRPPHWSGYRVRPERIEFWFGKADRLHERYLFTRTDDGWDVTMLNP